MTGLTTAATANSAQAAAPSNTYRITNVASHSTLRAYQAGEEVFVSSTRESPGPFELWHFERSESGYTIQNVGLSMTQTSDSYAAARQATEGEAVITSRDATVWSIEPAGNGTFVIKVPGEDLLWNAEPPVIPRGNVKLRDANGSDTQRWTFVPATQ
ncbi:hypothetical protein ACFOY2_12480 [Nonomuraea purpurea]|uniref:Ricin B lectin domain-containing protein n=1 Tax=Nonomuraea purpurea TaxID=1849276 RepID=A0ABV8G209_9ACTN